MWCTLVGNLFGQSWQEKTKSTISPVHVVLVSLLVDQLSGLFLTFFGRPKKKFVQSQGIFGQSLNFFWSGSDFLVY